MFALSQIAACQIKYFYSDDAVQYVAARWPETVRVSPLTRIRLFLAISRHRETPTRLPRVVERVLTERAKYSGGASEEE